MKWNRIGGIAVAMAVLVGTWVVAQTPAAPNVAPITDSRIGKILEQNEKVLKNQDEILKQLAEIRQELTVLKFRTH